MKKKLIGLSTLLLVLLLGLFSTCYADVNHDWTENQLKNVIYNYLHPSYSDSYIESYFNYHATEITNLVNKMNSNKYVYIVFQRTGPSNFFIGYGNTDSVWYRSTGNGKLYMANSSGYNYWVMSFGNSAGWENSGYYSIDAFNMNYYYFSKTVYNNANATSVFFSGGMYPSTYWEGPYLDDYFVYSYNPDLTDIQVPNIYAPNELTTIKSMTYNDFVGEYVAIVGMLKYLDYIQVTQAYWDNSISDWKLYRYNDNYITNNDYESTDPIEVKCPNGWWVGNTIIKFTCYPTWGNEVGDILEFWVYLVDNNTIINNGVLQIGTFSGDYNNNMQNDLNNQLADERTQEIINTITDDSQVNGILNDFGSGDINTFASKFGLPSIPNPFSNFIETIFYGITDVLTLDGDVTLDFGILGTLNSSQFATPTNAVTIFLSSFLTFIFVYYMIELGYSTLMSIREFNLDKSGIYHVEGMHPESGLQADGSWRLL